MTFLARLSLANRGIVALMAIIVTAFGVFTVPRLKQQLFPSLEFPAASVVATYPGAAPDVVEQQVTVPIEERVRGISGVTDVVSTSREGSASVQVQFEYGTDVAGAVSKIQDAVNQVSRQLPSTVTPQVVAGSTDDIPVVQLAVGSTGDQQQLAEKINKSVLPELTGIDGVNRVTLQGTRDKVVTIRPDQAKLAAAGLSATAITSALTASSTPVPAGSVTSGDKTLTVQVGSRITALDDIRNLYLMPSTGSAGAGATGAGAGTSGAGAQSRTGATAAGPGGGQAAPTAAPTPVRLGDVATVTDEYAPATSLTRTNGKPSLGISITQKSDGNAVSISHAVRDKLPALTRTLGGDTQLTVVYDQAPYVERSIRGLTTEGLLGLAMAVIVILVFLLSVRSTLVTAVSIPLSVVIALIGLSTGGYSLNILTLGALTIAIGRVVDDSIVVLENIKRHLGYGEDKTTAVITAVREVAGAVTASTLTTVAVFAPIAFVSGLIGQLFSSFAITVVVALLASLLVALTVIPVLAYWFLKPPKHSGDAEAFRAEAEARERNGALQRAYVPVIRWATGHRWSTVALAVVLLVGTFALVPALKTNFLDRSGQNTFNLTQTMPVSTSLEATDAAAKRVEGVLAGFPEIASYQVSIGGRGTFSFGGAAAANTASYSIMAKDGTDITKLENAVRDKVGGLTGVGKISVGSGGGGFNAGGLEVTVQATDPQVLSRAAEQVRTAMAGIPHVVDVSSDLSESTPRIQVTVRSDQAARYGLNQAAIGQLVGQALRGSTVTQVTIDGAARDVVLRGGSAPADLDAIKALTVPTAAGAVRLDQVAEVTQEPGPVQISRTDGARSATVSGTATGNNTGAASSELRTRLAKLTLPAGATYTIGGVSANQSSAFADLGLALVAAIAIVFLIMVATFRSLVQPLLLLVSIPFAATGALVLLLVTGTALGVAALIGMLMLVGIVVTNAIVLMDLINQYRRQGMSVQDAVIEGGRRRLRPILMTAFATIFALVPMALGLTGEGGFISKPLAIVVIGGLFSSTLLTLVLVPTLYTAVELRADRRRERRQTTGEPERELVLTN
ncbi:efflux RND transporter permease subunit [Planosporangium sp. 12N6]|uniref:efflux RND transporter permease subunit n=1 Tax=Planosporangium spinosum TaxID=3402278 RepID=UPI003CF3D9FB